jgi:hypothetical protein
VEWTTGGNIGDSAGGVQNWFRIGIRADAAKVTWRVNGATTPYRFIVDDQYVDATGTVTTSSSGTQYISLDFASVGGRKSREIILEGQAGSSFVGVYVGATERVTKLPPAEFRSVIISDSWGYGASATALGDSVFAVMADILGFKAHMNSGVGGTGWDQTTTTLYRFDQRVANGDEALNGAPTGPIFLSGSINDKFGSASNITSRCAATINLLRSRYSDIPIIVFGTQPAQAGQTGTLSLAANEAAVKAAVDQFTSDRLIAFVPVIEAVGGVYIPIGAATGHPLMADDAHLNTAGCLAGGQWYADRTLEVLEAMAA